MTLKATLEGLDVELFPALSEKEIVDIENSLLGRLPEYGRSTLLSR